MESEQCSTPLYASLLFIKGLYYKNTFGLLDETINIELYSDIVNKYKL